MRRLWLLIKLCEQAECQHSGLLRRLRDAGLLSL